MFTMNEVVYNMCIIYSLNRDGCIICVSFILQQESLNRDGCIICVSFILQQESLNRDGCIICVSFIL